MCPFSLTKRDPRDVLTMLRKLYSRRPETRDLEPWELQTLLRLLNYTDDLLPGDEIATAVEVAHRDFDPDEGVA